MYSFASAFARGQVLKAERGQHFAHTSFAFGTGRSIETLRRDGGGAHQSLSEYLYFTPDFVPKHGLAELGILNRWGWTEPHGSRSAFARDERHERNGVCRRR